jgi:hypothetical protein
MALINPQTLHKGLITRMVLAHHRGTATTDETISLEMNAINDFTDGDTRSIEKVHQNRGIIYR